jgi:hypothetical protein
MKTHVLNLKILKTHVQTDYLTLQTRTGAITLYLPHGNLYAAFYSSLPHFQTFLCSRFEVKEKFQAKIGLSSSGYPCTTNWVDLSSQFLCISCGVEGWRRNSKWVCFRILWHDLGHWCFFFLLSLFHSLGFWA